MAKYLIINKFTNYNLGQIMASDDNSACICLGTMFTERELAFVKFIRITEFAKK